MTGTESDTERLRAGWRESIALWQYAAAELQAAGYGMDSVAAPGGRSARQCLTHAAECERHLAESAGGAKAP